MVWRRKREREREAIQVKAFVPVRIERPFANSSCLCLFAIDGCDGKRIGKPWKHVRKPITMTSWQDVVVTARTKHISLVEAIGSNDCKGSSVYQYLHRLQWVTVLFSEKACSDNILVTRRFGLLCQRLASVYHTSTRAI